MPDATVKQGDKIDWTTPPEFFYPLHEKYNYTVDACAGDINHLLPRYWTKEIDALKQDWTGERVWCNPPFGREYPRFVEHAIAHFGEYELAHFLIPCKTDTKIFHRIRRLAKKGSCSFGENC